MFTVGLRLTGVDQGSRVLSRVDTQMSFVPIRPLGRLELRKNSSPSRRIAVRVSSYGLLSSGTRTAGPNDPSSPSVLTQMWKVPGTPDGPSRTCSRDVPADDSRLFILEVGQGGIVFWAIDQTEVDRFLPTEVVMLVASSRYIEVV